MYETLNFIIMSNVKQGGLLKALFQSFTVSNDLTDLEIVVFKSSDFTDHSKQTHIIINLANEITEIKYYTTKQ